jgi:hypothetical protein
VNTGLRIHPREVRAPRCRTSESRALAMSRVGSFSAQRTPDYAAGGS